MMNTTTLKQQNTHLWVLRLQMTQQMLFNGLKKLANQSNCAEMNKTLNQQWFSGYDINLVRMLPDGHTTPGAPGPSDLAIRHGIVSEVLDGLKQRPRGGDKPSALFALQLPEYDLALAMTQLYGQISKMIDQGAELDGYQASQAETTAYAMLNVLDEDDSAVLYKALDDEDYQACPL